MKKNKTLTTVCVGAIMFQHIKMYEFTLKFVTN